jgi:hypothetical protein
MGMKHQQIVPEKKTDMREDERGNAEREWWRRFLRANDGRNLGLSALLSCISPHTPEK